MTDDEPGPGLAGVAITPADILAPMLAPTEGLREHVDLLRRADAGRVAPGVHPDVDDHTSCAICTDPGEGEELLDVSSDPRLQPGGAAEAEFEAHAARHREGRWPRSAFLVDRRAVRHGYGPGAIPLD